MVFGDSKQGMTFLTVSAGHILDIVRTLVGEFTAVRSTSAILTLMWRNTETGEEITPGPPDYVAFTATTSAGVLVAGDLTSALATEPCLGDHGRRNVWPTDDRWLGMDGHPNPHIARGQRFESEARAGYDRPWDVDRPRHPD